jgi:hypothetical protein
MRWPTRDGVIPLRLFLALEDAIANIAAAEQLQMYYGTLLSGAQIHGGPEGRPAIDRAVADLNALAFPEAPEL